MAITTNTKVYLGTNNTTYNVANDYTTVIGAADANNDAITIAAGVNNVTVASTIEAITIVGNIADFKFKQGFGSNIEIYETDGTTLVMSLTDVAGKTLSFTDAADLALTYDAVVSVDGTAITTTAAALSGTTTVLADVSDESLNLVDADGSNVSNTIGATSNVTFTTAATIAQIDAVEAVIDSAGSGSTLTYTSITDDVANLFEVDGTTVDAMVLTATNLVANDTVTVAQLDALALVNTGGTTTYTSITDDVANLFEVDGTTVDAMVLTATNLVANDTVTIVEYEALDLATNGVVTTAVDVTGGTDAIVLNNNILTVNATFLSATDTINVNGAGTLVGGSDIDTAASTGLIAAADFKTIIVDDAAATNWSDLLSVLDAAITVDADEVAANAETIIAIDNGADTRLYLFSDDATSNGTIESTELSLVATLTGVTNLAEASLVLV